MKKPTGIWYIFLIYLFIPISSTAFAEENISGEIRTGFRVVDVDLSSKKNLLVVYRGDYVKFEYPGKYGSLTFAMPELKYSGTLLPDPAKSPFFKMKATGSYLFTLGEATGIIKVINLVRPNYIEVTAVEASELLKNINPYILDVRTVQEYQQIHLDGAELIPIQQLQQRIHELESKKHEDIFIYCATGNRSTVAARILADSGYKRIYNLRYGVFDWAKQGYPYKTGKLN